MNSGGMAALFFAHLLQVVGQFRQRGGAVPHKALQAVALALQQLLLAQVHRLHGLRLAQVHVKGQQADGGDGGNADARQHQRLLDLLAALAFGLGAVALLLTQSRGAWIGFAAGAGLYWLLAWRRFLFTSEGGI